MKKIHTFEKFKILNDQRNAIDETDSPVIR